MKSKGADLWKLIIVSCAWNYLVQMMPLNWRRLQRITGKTLIDVDFLGRRIRIQNRTEDILHRAFGTNMHPTWEDFEIFLQERCFPASRGNVHNLQ